METLQKLGAGIPLRMGVLGHVWVFGPSVLHHIIRDTGTRLEVSAPTAFFDPPNLTSTMYSQAQGASVQAIFAAGQLIGRPSFGLILDRFGMYENHLHITSNITR